MSFCSILFRFILSRISASRCISIHFAPFHVTSCHVVHLTPYVNLCHRTSFPVVHFFSVASFRFPLRSTSPHLPPCSFHFLSSLHFLHVDSVHFSSLRSTPFRFVPFPFISFHLRFFSFHFVWGPLFSRNCVSFLNVISMSFRFKVFRFASTRYISYRLMSIHLISYRFRPFRVMLFLLSSYCFVSFPFTSLSFISFHFSFLARSFRFILFHVMSIWSAHCMWRSTTCDETRWHEWTWNKTKRSEQRRDDRKRQRRDEMKWNKIHNDM